MSLGGNFLKAVVVKKLLSAVSAADTAAATSGWIDVSDAIGDIAIILSVGALTGSIAWTFHTATDNAGAGATAITPDEGSFAAGAAGAPQVRTFDAKRCLGFVRATGTIVTGPALVDALVIYHPKTPA